eukprot:1157795-Pelagomonas_calceolata.AAC.4
MFYTLCYKSGAYKTKRFLILNSFFPGRSTLQPLYILRHLEHAVQTYKPHGSSRLFTAFIDFKQAYESIPRDQRNHLQQCHLPNHLLNVAKNQYHEYFLIDGDKHAWVCPTYGVKQDCLLSMLLSTIYLHDISDTSEGIEGACTENPISMFHIYYTLMTCLQIVSRPCSTLG